MKIQPKIKANPLFLPCLFATSIFILLVYGIAVMIMQLFKYVNISLLSLDFVFSFVIGTVSLVCAILIFSNRFISKNKKLTKILSLFTIVTSCILCLGGLFNALFTSGVIIPLVIVLLDWYVYVFVAIAILTWISFLIILVKECFPLNKKQFKSTPIIIGLSLLSFVAIVPILPINLVHTSYPASFKFIGHRGYSAKYFQNSADAFKVNKPPELLNRSIDNSGTINNFWGYETDVQMDSEGALWCSHYVNPFEVSRLKISEMATDVVRAQPVKTHGSIDVSSLDSKAFPSGKLNPYHINVSSKMLLLPFAETNEGYLNNFINNNLHPIIELKIDSLTDTQKDTHSSQVNSSRVSTYIENILKAISTASDEDPSLPSRIIFISFFDVLLKEMIKAFSHDFPATNIMFQKLLDDGSIGQYVKEDLSPYRGDIDTKSFTKANSETNWKNWKKYVDGSWASKSRNPISINPYYAFVTNNMINEAHKNQVEVNCYTANYTRLEVCEPISLALLAKSGIDMITCDDYFHFS